MTLSKRKFFLVGLVATTLLTIVSGGWYIIEIAPWHSDFHHRAPQDVFRDITGKAMLPGITNIKMAARGYFNKRWVWMSFHATDAALNTLTREYARSDIINDPASVHRAVHGTAWAAHPRYNDTDMMLVDWHKINIADKREVYELSSQHTVAGSYRWLGYMIVDRKSHSVYIHAGGD